MRQAIISNYLWVVRACRLNFAQPCFEGYFRGYLSAVARNVAGYVTNNNRKIDRKKAQNKLNKNLKEKKFRQALIL